MRHLGWFSNTLKCNGNIWNIYWNCINSKDVQRKKNAQTTLKIATIGTDFIGFKMLIRRFLGFLDRGSIGLINVPPKHFEILMHFLRSQFRDFWRAKRAKNICWKIRTKIDIFDIIFVPINPSIHYWSLSIFVFNFKINVFANFAIFFGFLLASLALLMNWESNRTSPLVTILKINAQCTILPILKNQLINIVLF